MLQACVITAPCIAIRMHFLPQQKGLLWVSSTELIVFLSEVPKRREVQVDRDKRTEKGVKREGLGWASIHDSSREIPSPPHSVLLVSPLWLCPCPPTTPCCLWKWPHLNIYFEVPWYKSVRAVTHMQESTYRVRKFASQAIISR